VFDTSIAPSDRPGTHRKRLVLVTVVALVGVVSVMVGRCDRASPAEAAQSARPSLSHRVVEPLALREDLAVELIDLARSDPISADLIFTGRMLRPDVQARVRYFDDLDYNSIRTIRRSVRSATAGARYERQVSWWRAYRSESGELEIRFIETNEGWRIEHVRVIADEGNSR